MKAGNRKLVKVKDENNNEITIMVKKPNSKVLSEAQHVAAKAWTDCVRDKIMTKQELKNFMYQNGIWSAAKDAEQFAITEKINKLEKELYIGKSPGQSMKVSEAKDIAIEMRILRLQLRDLIAEKMSLEQNTAESLADNAKFDYIVAKSTFHENGELVYKSIEDYNDNSDSSIAFAAATAMAELLYSLDKDFEANLPENKFLVSQKLVNEDLSLINNDGETVDTNGRRINALGHYINDEGKRIDVDGNLLDENGNYIPSVQYIDDVHEVTEQSNKKTKKGKKQSEPVLDDVSN